MLTLPDPNQIDAASIVQSISIVKKTPSCVIHTGLQGGAPMAGEQPVHAPIRSPDSVPATIENPGKRQTGRAPWPKIPACSQPSVGSGAGLIMLEPVRVGGAGTSPFG
jgi:hypothetical protein